MNKKSKVFIKTFLLIVLSIATFLLAIRYISDKYYVEAGEGGITFGPTEPSGNTETADWTNFVLTEMDPTGSGSGDFVIGHPYATYDAGFPINDISFSKSPTYYCTQHGVAFGGQGNKRDEKIGSHTNYIVTAHEIAQGDTTSDPLGDIDDSAEVYLDSSNQLNYSNFEGYTHYGYVEKGDDADDKNAFTNWVYIESSLQFDCETPSGSSSMTGGGLAFILATLQGKYYPRIQGTSLGDYGAYDQDPCQHAVWTWLGNCSGYSNEYEPIAKLYQKYHDDVEPYMKREKGIYITPDANVGTTYSNGTYTIGPFTMSDYIEAKNYKYDAISLPGGQTCPAGNLQQLMGDDHKGTIIKGEAIFTNEAGEKKVVQIKESEILAPNATGSFTFSEADIAGYDELLDLRFTYQIIHAAGGGQNWLGYAYEITFPEIERDMGCSTVICKDSTGSGGDHFGKRPGRAPNPYESGSLEGDCYHHWYNSYEDWETTDSEGNTHSHHSHWDYDDYEHPMSDYTCSRHNHHVCEYFEYDNPIQGDDVCQDGAALVGELYNQRIRYTTRVAVPVKTQMILKKYITKVEHVGESCTNADTFPEYNDTENEAAGVSTDRNTLMGYEGDDGVIPRGAYENEDPDFTPASSSGSETPNKMTNPVKVERGDEVTFTVKIINNSRFPTIVKVKDVLPQEGTNCECTSMPSEIRNSSEITVEAHDVKTYEIKVRPIVDNGDYINFIRFTTTNVASEHMKYSTWGSRATFGAHTRGNLVNVFNLDADGAHQDKVDAVEWDHDKYRIKKYYVSLEKYIYEVNHESYSTGRDISKDDDLDTTMVESNKRSLNPAEGGTLGLNTAETEKANKPVYIEYGDRVTYKIKIYNTCNPYVDDNEASPYYKPDLVYVNVKDTLPENYELDPDSFTIDIDNGNMDTCAITKNDTEFRCQNVRVPANGITTITVTLVATDNIRQKLDENKAEFYDEIRNINKGPGPNNNVDDKYDVCWNVPKKEGKTNHLISKDIWIINDYDAEIDKYISHYDPSETVKNETAGFTENETNQLDLTKESLSITSLKDLNEFTKKEQRYPYSEDDKYNHPLMAEKNEELVYSIRVSNNSDKNTQYDPGPYSLETGDKPQTQVRPTRITDYLQKGLTYLDVQAIQYQLNEDNTLGDIITRYEYSDETSIPVTHEDKGEVTVDNVECTKHYFDIDEKIILNPGECIVYYVRVRVDESNMYLYRLMNKVELTTLTNVNHIKDQATSSDDAHDRIVYERGEDTEQNNISTQQESKDYVKMKDLVIAGKVWVDENKDGLYEKTSTDITENHEELKKEVLVRLVYVDPTNKEHVIRTTRTNEKGEYSFAFDEDGKPYKNEYKIEGNPGSLTSYESRQRVPKADPKDTTYKSINVSNNSQVPEGNISDAKDKDDNLNYENATPAKYYIEFVYDGATYKATDIYANYEHLKGPDDSEGSKWVVENNNADGYGDYVNDSNAYEFKDEREAFNRQYETIGYDIAYSVDKDRTNSSTDDVTMMAFDKVGHTSTLLEETNLLNKIETWTPNDRHRAMTARSFVKDTNQNRSDDFNNTNLLWLFPLKSDTDTETQTEYLKYINLGLEEREDVDISIQKDVYQVKLTVNGEEVIYNYDKEPSDTLYKQTQDYRGIIRDSDYKYRYNQYANEAVREYNTYKTEANMEVTYKIAITNNKIEDDEPGREKYNDIPIEVTIDEIADYYDKNFITYTDGAEAADIACGYDTIKDGSDGGASSYTEPYNFETGANKTTANCISMKRKENGDFKTDRKVKIAEAWYNGLEDREKGEYSEQLELHNKSIYNDKRDFESDGYQTLYIRGDALSDVRIKEGETHFVYVKYVVDKYEDTRNLKIADDKSDSLGLEGISEINAYSTWYGKVQTKESDVEYWNPDAADNEKIIKKSAKYTDDEAKHSEYKNLHPEYEAGYPAGLIDKDSNASNIGNPDGLSKITSIPTGNTLTEIIPEDDARKLEESKLNKGSEKASDTKIISADVVDEYEDDTFKVGIEDWLQIDGKLIKLKEGKKAEKGEEIVIDNVTREISGVVWDDARTDSVTDSETNAVQYSGDGIIDREEKNDVAKTNENIRSLHCDLYKANSSDSYDSVLMDKENNGIPKTKLDDGTEIPGNVASEEEQFYEKQDFVVRDARVQLVEIVKVPTTTGEKDEDGNPVIRYYEEIGDEIKEYYEDHASEYWGDSLANDLLKSTVYAVRTDEKGQYTLKGFMPGYYIVRFGYGDTTSSEMMTFNGQDYKSSKYMTTLDNVEDVASRGAAKTIDNVTFKSQSDTTYDPYTQKTELSEEMERKYDDILTALQRKNLNDARDDEISRLDSIAYSEVMTNAKAETLKGVSSTTQYKEKDENGKFIESSGVSSTKISNEDFEETKENMNKALAQNVQMNAETITFYVKPERVETSTTGQATSWYEESTWSSEIETSETSQTINILDYIRGNYANCTNVEIHEFEDEGLIDHGTTGKIYANTYNYQIPNIDFGITYRPESQITLDKEIEEIKITTSDQKDILKVAFADRVDETTNEVKIDQETGRIQRRVDEENSIGLDKVQYLFNDDEHTDQGFFYINIDDEILQGSTISIEYQIRAENISEIDRISTNLDVLRYRENLTSDEMNDIDTKGYLQISNPVGLTGLGLSGVTLFNKLPILFTQQVVANVKKANADDPSIYLGSRTAERYLHDRTFSTDSNHTSDGEYRIIEKLMTTNDKENYYGMYMGGAYYTNSTLDKDTIVDLKVSKILDYIDNDMEPSEKNTGKDHTWDRTTSDSMMAGDGYNGRYLKHSVFTKDAERYRLIDKDGVAYDTEKKSNLVVYRDDRRADDGKDLQNPKGLNEDEVKTYDEKNSSMSNISISRYMEPRYHVDYTGDYNVNVETSNQYAGILHLTADREVGAETDMDNLNFDNIAEIIEFTTPTGRRTNFKTTIGNAEISDKKGVYKVSLDEPDASATELVTLTPPTGLDRLHRAITTVVETTSKVAIPMAIIIVIALIGVGTVTFGIAKYRSRRIK